MKTLGTYKCSVFLLRILIIPIQKPKIFYVQFWRLPKIHSLPSLISETNIFKSALLPKIKMVLAKDIQSGEYFRYKGDILRIVRKEVVAVGTHSHSKSKLIVQNLEGGGEKQLVFAHEDKLENIDVIKSKAQVILKTQDSVQ